jgi:hypothetical protein
MRDLNSAIPGAPNFKYREFVKSDTAIRLGIVNEPSDEEWRSIEKVAVNILQPVREKFGRIGILSGFRCLELNREIKSSDTSNHIKGEAVDFEPIDTNVSMLDIVLFIYDELEFRTCICEYFPDGWIHCDYRSGGNICSLKLKDSDHDYEEISLDDLMDLYDNGHDNEILNIDFSEL